MARKIFNASRINSLLDCGKGGWRIFVENFKKRGNVFQQAKT